MRSIRVPLVVLLFAALLGGALAAQRGQAPGPGGRGGGRGGITIAAGEECPPGTTETRPQQCQAPEFDPPSIVDYRPRSTLVVEEHPVPRAKYPVIDIHGHAGRNLSSVESVTEMVGEMDALNLRVYVAADNLSVDRVREAMDVLASSSETSRFRLMAGINFQGVGTPGWAERAVSELEAALDAGAIAVGEVSKSFGLTTRKADGSRLRVDDPELDPIWEMLGRRNIPAFIHTAEPQEFFSPLDMHNERWLELALFRDRRNYEPGQVTFEELMTERKNLFRRHPDTQFIAAHLGWHANDLQRLGRLLDEFPNVTTEMGAVLYDLGRQPRAAREFFIEYQDRILFGKDSYQPSEFPYYWRVLETTDEYFDYYRNYHAFWKLYGLDLPDDVLKKVYYANALRVVPGLPQDGWPE